MNNKSAGTTGTAKDDLILSAQHASITRTVGVLSSKNYDEPHSLVVAQGYDIQGEHVQG